MPFKPFEKGNSFSRLGGLAKRGHGFKDKAREWVSQNGFKKAIAWVNGKDDNKDVPWPARQFAMGLLFSYALGRPAEQIQIENKTDILINLAKDPSLNELASRFGAVAARVREIENGCVVDGEITIQAESPPASGV